MRLLATLILPAKGHIHTAHSHRSHQRVPHLHAKGEYGNDYFQDERQSQLPHGTVDSRTSRSVRQLTAFACVEMVLIITELGGVQKATVIE